MISETGRLYFTTQHIRDYHKYDLEENSLIEVVVARIARQELINLMLWSCWSSKERYCLIADRGNPLDGSGTGDTRTVQSLADEVTGTAMEQWEAQGRGVGHRMQFSYLPDLPKVFVGPRSDWNCRGEAQSTSSNTQRRLLSRWMRRAIELNTGVSFETWLKPFNQHLTNHSQSGTSLANCARSRRIRMAQVRVITRYQQNPFDLRPPKVGSRQLTDSHLGPPGTSWDWDGIPLASDLPPERHLRVVLLDASTQYLSAIRGAEIHARLRLAWQVDHMTHVAKSCDVSCSKHGKSKTV